MGFSLELESPFPLEWTVFPGNEGFGEKVLYGLSDNFDFPPARENLRQAIFLLPLKMFGVCFVRGVSCR